MTEPPACLEGRDDPSSSTTTTSSSSASTRRAGRSRPSCGMSEEAADYLAEVTDRRQACVQVAANVIETARIHPAKMPLGGDLRPVAYGHVLDALLSDPQM